MHRTVDGIEYLLVDPQIKNYENRLIFDRLTIREDCVGVFLINKSVVLFYVPSLQRYRVESYAIDPQHSTSPAG